MLFHPSSTPFHVELKLMEKMAFFVSYYSFAQDMEVPTYAQFLRIRTELKLDTTFTNSFYISNISETGPDISLRTIIQIDFN